jgi:hypothetical protein
MVSVRSNLYPCGRGELFVQWIFGLTLHFGSAYNKRA